MGEDTLNNKCSLCNSCFDCITLSRFIYWKKKNQCVAKVPILQYRSSLSPLVTLLWIRTALTSRVTLVHWASRYQMKAVIWIYHNYSSCGSIKRGTSTKEMSVILARSLCRQICPRSNMTACPVGECAPACIPFEIRGGPRHRQLLQNIKPSQWNYWPF